MGAVIAVLASGFLIGAAARWNHSSGLFAALSGTWRTQDPSDLAGDSFWQVDAYAGYRMLRRRLEFKIGVLNLTDEDYRLTPLTPYPEVPRARTFFTSLRLNF